MAMSYIKPAGLPKAAKDMLVPENIRAGVHIKGGGVDVTGAYETTVAAVCIAGCYPQKWSNGICEGSAYVQTAANNTSYNGAFGVKTTVLRSFKGLAIGVGNGLVSNVSTGVEQTFTKGEVLYCCSTNSHIGLGGLTILMLRDLEED